MLWLSHRLAWLFLLGVAALHPLAQHVRSGDKRSPPLYAEVPDTQFNCADHMVGYFADMEAHCQVYHMCDTYGRQYSYLCPNMTVFNQRFMVCDHWHHVNCSNSGQYYDLNMRMAGGGKKLPQAGRMANLIQIDNINRRNRLNNRNRKTSQRTPFNKKAMKKMKMELQQNQRRISGTTLRRRNTTQKPTSVTLRPNQSSRSQPNAQKTTRNSFLRPLTTTSKPPPRKIPTKAHVRTTTPKSATRNLNPSKFTSKSTTKKKKSQSTTPRPTTSPHRGSPADSNTKRTPVKPSTFGVTEIKNFSKLNGNQSNSPPPFAQMLPGMVARGSGPRFGFGFPQMATPPPGHFDILKEFQDNPLFIELSRQILLPRLYPGRVSFSGRPLISTKDDSTDSSPTPLNPRSPTSKFVFPRKQGNVAAFPIQPIVFSTTPKPIVMTGPRQEDITELQAKRNGRHKITQHQSDLKTNIRSSVHGNQAFFIPETRLIPPDKIEISDDDVSAKLSHLAAELLHKTELSTEDADEGEDEDSHDHMTMIFPNHKREMNEKIGGILLNPKCPECHPAFLTPGKCTPCVRIR